MLQWYERYPDRLELETTAYKNHGFSFQLNETLLQQKRLIVFEGRIHADDGEHALRVIYSPMFPSVGVQVLDVGKTYRRHQNPKEGNLCLPHWEPNLTGAEKVDEAIGLINLLNKGGNDVHEAEIPAPEPESTWYRYTPGKEVLIPESLITLAKGDRGGFSLSLFNHSPLETLKQAVLTSIHDVASKSDNTAHLGPLNISAVPAVKGYWIRATEAPPFDLSSYDEWAAWAISKNAKLRYDIEKQQNAISAKPNDIKAIAFAVVYPEEGPYLKFHDQWQVCVRWSKGTNVAEDWIMRPHLLPSSDTFFQRIPSLRDLEGKRVVILGLGALGSVIATDLARAGVKDFVLVDHDDFRAGNVVRHASDLRTFGVPKVLATNLQISYINPGSSIVMLPLRIGMAPLSPELYEDQLEVLEAEISKSHLLISTICDSPVEGWVDDLARSLGIPSVYAGVFYGAWGGQIFFSSQDGPCFRCYEQSDAYATVSMPDDQPPTYLDGCSDPSFPGPGFDTSVVANLATRLSVQVLLGGKGYPSASYNLISWSSRGKDIGDFPQISLGQLERSPNCRTCSCQVIK